MQTVYFISGLGADKRAFSLLDLSFCEPVFVDWLAPLKDETLSSYASRIRLQIPDVRPIIIGLSFGGMLTAEMASQDPTVIGILISSCKSKNEIPFYLKAGKFIRLYKWLPAKFIQGNSTVAMWLFGIKGQKHKEIFRSMAAAADTDFNRWAISAILHWSIQTVPSKVIHIHGTADRILPLKFAKPDYVIKGGTHVLPMSHPDELSRLLKNIVTANGN